MKKPTPFFAGFTLVEMAIVLVVIGLIVGGIFVGRDLVENARVRAQLTQIEKYSAAVKAFQLKYNNFLPGDIPNPHAVNFGFVSRGSNRGQGDGNGIIEGNRINSSATNSGVYQTAGETLMFWVDLSAAGLIDGNFTAASPSVTVGTVTTGLGAYFPAARLQQENYVYVASGLVDAGHNYFGVQNIVGLGTVNCGGPSSGYMDSNFTAGQAGWSVRQASDADQKIDDGFPQSGRVMAIGLSCLNRWAGTWSSPGVPFTTATAAGNYTCFDNGNVNGGVQKYNAYNNNANLNCYLAFRF